MRYVVKALSASNEVVSFEVEAADEHIARAHAKQQGHTVFAIKASSLGRRWAQTSKFQTLLFTQELLGLLTAGLSLVESLEAIAEKGQRSENRKILVTLLQYLQQGRSLSAAFEAFPTHFPPLYVAAVRASEQTGDLPEALRRYIAYREQADRVRTKIISASIYPVSLLVIGGLVMFFLMFYVVPRFSRIYDEIPGEIPFLSRLLMEWGQLVETHWTAIVIAGALAMALAGYLLMLQLGRRWLVQNLLRIPALRERTEIYQLSRLYRTLGMLLSGGIPLLQAIDMASGLLTMDLQQQLRAAASKINDGLPLSQSMQEHGLTTPISLRLLRVGERTGTMGETMEHIANFFDEDMARWMDWFTRLFEPILMALIGIIIGSVVILMYMPIFELAGSIQ